MEGFKLLLEKRVAVITGSANGMGKAMAQKFAGEGCDIVVADIDLEGAKKVADGIKAAGRKAVAIQVDMCNSTEIKSLIEQSVKEFGQNRYPGEQRRRGRRRQPGSIRRG